MLSSLKKKKKKPIWSFQVGLKVSSSSRQYSWRLEQVVVLTDSVRCWLEAAYFVWWAERGRDWRLFSDEWLQMLQFWESTETFFFWQECFAALHLLMLDACICKFFSSARQKKKKETEWKPSKAQCYFWKHFPAHWHTFFLHLRVSLVAAYLSHEGVISTKNETFFKKMNTPIVRCFQLREDKHVWNAKLKVIKHICNWNKFRKYNQR